MDNNGATMSRPEALQIRLPELVIGRLGSLEQAVNLVDSVIPNDLDIQTSADPAYPEFAIGNAALTAASEAPDIIPTQDSPMIREAAQTEDAMIDLSKKVEDEIDHKFWEVNVLNDVPVAPVLPINAPMPHLPMQPVAAQAPAQVAPNPLLDWGTPAPTHANAMPIYNPAPTREAQVLQFPRQTTPHFDTDRLPGDIVAETARDVTEPVVVRPATSFWSATNPTSAEMPQMSPEMQERMAREQAARDRVNQSFGNLQAA